jgi:hypothetical protein
MKKSYVILPAVMVLVAIGIAGGLAKTALKVPAPGSMTVTSFTATRPALRPGEQTSIRISVSDDAHGPLTYAWHADAGTLSAIDANPVIWTAPETEGRYQVSVEVTNAAGITSRGSAGILVSKYPADPLIMNIDPVSGNQRSNDIAGRSSAAN